MNNEIDYICPVLLILDTSGSMDGDPIAQLNEAIHQFKNSFDEKAANKIEVAIINFGPVNIAQDFISIKEFRPPTFESDDLTPMGEAIDTGLNLLEQRVKYYQQNDIINIDARRSKADNVAISSNITTTISIISSLLFVPLGN